MNIQKKEYGTCPKDLDTLRTLEERLLNIMREVGQKMDRGTGGRALSLALYLFEEKEYARSVQMAELTLEEFERILDETVAIELSSIEIKKDLESLPSIGPRERKLIDRNEENIKDNQENKITLHFQRLEVWLLVAKAKYNGGNHSEAMDYFELIVNFTYEQNAIDAYEEHFSFACIHIIWQGHINKCLVDIIKRKTVLVGSRIMAIIFGRLLDLDIDSLLPEPLKVIDAQITQPSSLTSITTSEGNINQWQETPSQPTDSTSSNSWLWSKAGALLKSVIQILWRIDSVRFVIKYTLMYVLVIADVFTVFLRLLLLYFSMCLVVHCTRKSTNVVTIMFVCIFTKM